MEISVVKFKASMHSFLLVFIILVPNYFQAFAIQSYVTGEGPYANFTKHISDPFG